MFVIVFALIPAEDGKVKSAQEIFEEVHKGENKAGSADDEKEKEKEKKGEYVDEGVD
jgi:hypothetical protein